MNAAQGWKKIKFGQLAKEKSNRVNKPSESGYDRYVGLEHLDSGMLTVKRWGSTKDVTSAMKLFNKNDILFARRNTYLRRISVAKFDGVCSGDIIVIEPILKEIVAGFLPLFMQWEYFENRVIALSAGAFSKRIKWKQLTNEDISIPPREEQKRIVNLVWAIEDNIEKTENLISINEKLKKGLLNELLTKNKWKVVSLGEEITFQKGKAPTSDILSITNTNKKNYLSTDSLRDNIFDQLIPVNGKMVDLDSEDVVILWDGSKAGEIFKGKEGYLSSTMVKLVFDKNKYNSDFLFYFLKTKEAYIKSNCKGTGIPHVDPFVVESLKLPKIKIDEQITVINYFKKMDLVLNNLNNQIIQLNNLKKKLTDELLKGELRLD